MVLLLRQTAPRDTLEMSASMLATSSAATGSRAIPADQHLAPKTHYPSRQCLALDAQGGAVVHIVQITLGNTCVTI